MHFQSETGVVGSEEDAAALLGLSAQLCALIGAIGFGLQPGWVILGLGLSRQKWKKELKLSPRNVHMDL